MRIYRKIRWVALAQGLYFSLIALWSLISVTSFIEATDYQAEVWLIKSVAILLLPLAIILFAAVRRVRPLSVFHIIIIIAGTAGFAIVKLMYYFRGIFSKAYLIDIAPDLLFFLWWTGILIHKLSKKILTPSSPQNQYYEQRKFKK